MGKRLFKVFIVLGYMVILSSMVGIVVEYFIDGKSDAVNFFPIVFLSLVPISLLSVVQYVVFGKMYLSFLFENKERYKWISGVIFAIFLGLSLLWGYAKKMEYDKTRQLAKYSHILNDTFIDYDRKNHKSFSPVTHKFLHDLIYGGEDINMTIAKRLPEKALNIAVKIRKMQQKRGKKMAALAKNMGYKDIKLDRFGTAWVKGTNQEYTRLNATLIREKYKGKQ